MKQLLEAASDQYWRYRDEWQKAKQAFLALRAEFESCRKVLERAEKAAQHIDDEQSRLSSLLAEEQAPSRDIQARELALAQQRVAVATQRTVVEGNRVVLEQLRAGTPRNLWDRLMGLFGRETRRMADLRQSPEARTQALADASFALAEMSKEVAVSEAQLGQRQEQQKAVSSGRVALERELEAHRRALQATQ
ncbi:hypothetical protein [Paludibacterium denitrificans]|uniref:hypothetical protein n=1 Tax=Paludibacterium denitrificans TaxID=2675226 RepID=UPI001E555679|nr:hypothetical protein [Paludibacterium denitrificans]